jgi:N-hydroxyarylamine O-acetyltransferase
MSDNFDLDRYLDRIGFTAHPAPDLATLSALHTAHVAAVPFEGLDPLLGRPVRLDLGSLQSKIIDGRRGGYCFEQNALFRAALEAIGFGVTGLAGRVRWMSPPDSPLGPRTHMLLKVDLPEGPYIADVGFGACVIDLPLRFAVDAEQRTAMASYRLRETAGHYALEAKQPGGWRTMYVFSLEPQIASDYELGNYYTSTSSGAPFTNTLIMERVDADGRYKLMNRRFVVEAREGEVTAAREIADAADLDTVLREMFRIVPPVDADVIFAKILGAGWND